jgi:hypothetical protein
MFRSPCALCRVDQWRPHCALQVAATCPSCPGAGELLLGFLCTASTGGMLILMFCHIVQQSQPTSTAVAQGTTVVGSQLAHEPGRSSYAYQITNFLSKCRPLSSPTASGVSYNPIALI